MTPPEDSEGPHGDEELVARPPCMTISEIFTRSYEIYRANPVIVVPTLIPMAWLLVGFFLLFAGFAGIYGPGMAHGGYFDPLKMVVPMMGSLGLFFLGFVVLLILAEGMTIEMIGEAFGGKRADLTRGWEKTKVRLADLVVASVLYAVIVLAGYMLFIVPGLILTALLYFVAQEVMIGGKGPVDALFASYDFVKANLVDSVIVVLISVAVPSVLSAVPIVGFVLSVASMPFMIALATLLYIDRSRRDKSNGDRPSWIGRRGSAAVDQPT